MTTQIFLLILTACAFITSLVTEGVKTTLGYFGIKYASNIIVAITSVVVGGVAMVVYYTLVKIDYTIANVLYMTAMVIANWLGATVGYDKVKQTIEQIISTFKGGK